jgi:two-component system sensor histidine kinase PhcS
MNALGVLSAGILHEVNNPLNFSLTALAVAKQMLPKDADSEPIDDAISGMERIRQISKDLGAFAHKNVGHNRDLIPLQSVVDLALRLCAQELSQIAVTVNIPVGLLVQASQTQLSQVLVNLLINGARATKHPDLKERGGQISIQAEHLNNRILIRLRDNGSGIAEQHLKQIFDPFYTTQAVGSGLGLGLSICHTIVSDHGGIISVTSEHGSWTEFTIELPAAAMAEASS